jgi:small subunit ribosomal protein S17
MENKRKVRIGKVVSNKMDKTAVVVVEGLKRHKLYKKVIRYQKRFKVHDEKNECKVGDMVKITETRPLSKEKRWNLTEIVRSGKVAEIQPGEINELQTAEPQTEVK